MSVQEFMQKTGLKVHENGYDLMEKAINLHMQEPESTMTEIYYELAGISRKSYMAIARCIARSVEKASMRMDAGLKEKLFKDEKKISAGVFVKTASYALRNHLI